MARSTLRNRASAIIASALVFSSVALVADACAGSAQPPIGPKRVEAVFGRTHLKMLPNISTVRPRGEVREYTFLRKDSTFVFGVALVVYSTSEHALRASITDRRGKVSKGVITLPSRTLRVRNVLLVSGAQARRTDVQVLARALARLGTPVSP